ncbi:MAG: STAS domain-containing protein [Thermoplasmatota archaeon]
MELKRIEERQCIRWVVEGDMDEDSVLSFESIITNSQDRGSDITIDLSGLTDLPNMGARGMGIITRKLEERGTCVSIVGAKGRVKERLKVSGVLKDQ